ncbi:MULTISPECIES: DUF779 domain-containing protein [Nocardiaceae]|jgi:uncharacterized protein (DUF779 family)|uniref:DUF779 domain-containing protein n=1 Tax=Nocardiaceae TaxID=85025 RepID=UPI001E5EF426|nr:MULTISPECIES: DUF779 domain-containing protein [Rhodococcus]MCZ4278173.1 DUF779 domain-containing protein [Rhodococcus yunnanensis]
MSDGPASAPPSRLRATAEAMELLRRLGGIHGELMMHQSGGCCDGSSPMCYPTGEFIVGDRDVLLGLLDLRLGVGEVSQSLPEGADAVPVWISGSQFEAWKHTQMILDVVPGRGSGFSLEVPEGLRFLSRGRAFTEDETAMLALDPPLLGADWEQGRRPAVPGEASVVAEAADACPVPGSTPQPPLDVTITT